ncbi:MAG: FtsB family cell division protein [Syntrophomonadales bacterium]|jgi:cell division protein FtsB
MKTRQTKPKRKKIRILNFRWLMVFLVVCSISFGSQVVTIWEMKQEIKSLTAKKEQLIQKNKQYQANLNAVRSDAMLEKLAREELGMIKPGEKLLVEVLP